MKKLSFRAEIFVYYIIVFVLITLAILTFQYEREKIYRTSQLENTLDNITEMVQRFIAQNELVKSGNLLRINEIIGIIPHSDTRITIINLKGNILYDNFVEAFNQMENHHERPEILKAEKNGFGANIRKSATTNQEFYYYAKKYPGYYIRTALVYNIEIKNFLRTNRVFVFFITTVFLLIGILLYFVTRRMAESITKLKDFSIKAAKNEPIEFDTQFPGNELGIIGGQIFRIYNNLKLAKDDLSAEREKLFNHLNALKEGIAFFSPQKEKTLSNSQFIQYLNLISRKTVRKHEDIFQLEELKGLNKYINNQRIKTKPATMQNLPHFEQTIGKGDKFFKIQSIIFPDSSFEIVISDNTRFEKRRLMKQQLTSNIAHELKTPLASIKGYLETISHNWPLPEDKQKYFIGKAYLQAERLTELINDVSLLNNIEDAGELFKFKPTDIRKVISDVYENFAIRLNENQISFKDQVKNGTVIRGNDSLLFSIFQNLVENSINYGGVNISIQIKVYHEDDNYYFISYSDSGNGIPEEHLPRIFERFYRIDYGRSREKGGTGLGLAIVKNAVLLHKGEISVRNRPEGGIEFMFSLAKK